MLYDGVKPETVVVLVGQYACLSYVPTAIFCIVHNNTILLNIFVYNFLKYKCLLFKRKIRIL